MTSERYSRQSFLGAAGQANIERAVIGFVGLGGGGSHMVQQFAHLGLRHFVVFDDDTVDESNLNRLVTAEEADVAANTPKTETARRRILGVQGKAEVEAHRQRWQDRPEALRRCDVVVGCADTFSERQQLEACCRRYGIVLVDIGMDLTQVTGEPPVMGGQVILSMPGHPCMFCLGFLTDERLGREATNYGAAGGRPQVVWPNGVLASSAVGVVVDLLTDWTRSLRGPVYLSYRGNDGTVQPHVRLKYLKAGPCPHYPPDQVGDPVFSSL